MACAVTGDIASRPSKAGNQTQPRGPQGLVITMGISSYRGQVFTFDVTKLETLLVLNSQWACHQNMANLEDTQPAL